jgi:uncharacterized Zn-binding protein involved in type VI secretion
MPGISRLYQDRAGGTLISGSNSTVFANGTPVAVLGSNVAGHGDSPHSGARMITASGRVFANGISVCRQGDSASCGHTASGSGNVGAG